MDKRLKEIAFGEWEGKSVARNQMEVPDEFLKFYFAKTNFAFQSRIFLAYLSAKCYTGIIVLMHILMFQYNKSE